jgi:iron only hydrogenase large subunit-like protein
MKVAHEDKFFHSVYLDEDNCVGCINCLKGCPTEAIRVRHGKSRIIPDYCIDCGECIRRCTHHARGADCDSIDEISDYDFTVALPAPSLYAQFNNLDDINIVLNSLISLGFDRVFEVSGAAELVSEKTRAYIEDHEESWPLLSTACPTVIRLIRVRFPSLIPHLIPLKAPVELAARIARKRAMEETGLPSNRIGIFFISPCPSKVTEANAPVAAYISEIDKVLAIKDVYPLLLTEMKKNRDTKNDLTISGRVGVGWGVTGGEAAGVFDDNILAADGMNNIIEVLESLEDEKFKQPLKFIELNACPGGCVGGVFCVDNPHLASSKLHHLNKYLPVTLSHCDDYIDAPDFFLEKEIKYLPVYSLGDDLAESMKNLQRVERLLTKLPQLDCGSCGAPTCRALAEDIVRGKATLDDCIYNLRDQYDELRVINSQLMKGAEKNESRRFGKNDGSGDNKRRK